MSTIYSNMKATHHSKNLRGLLDHARRSSPVLATVYDFAGGARLAVHYRDGCLGSAPFTSYEVAVAWVAARRSWGFAAPQAGRVSNVAFTEFHR